jgi:hypothetical protein
VKTGVKMRLINVRGNDFNGKLPAWMLSLHMIAIIPTAYRTLNGIL